MSVSRNLLEGIQQIGYFFLKNKFKNKFNKFNKFKNIIPQKIRKNVYDKQKQRSVAVEIEF